MASAEQLQAWQQRAQQLCIDSIGIATTAAVHFKSSIFIANLMTVLLRKYWRYDDQNPHNPNSDRLIFLKAHTSPLLQAIHKVAEFISDKLMSLRQSDSRLQEHPIPIQP
ncbi:MAG: hypothetical protein PUP91_38935 [Rhizonema sp. PD37]|nr:hypothetical protein [Rhizonema sp. PD37]